jgi:hypothetical protein
MDEEGPLDLQSLDPGDPPDQARKAVRRFRVHVVLFTVVAVVGASSLTAWAIARTLSDRSTGTVAMQVDPLRGALLYGRSCRGSGSTFPDMQIGVLQMARMPGGTLAAHLVVHSDAPLTEQRDQPDGSSFARFTSIASTAGGANVANVEAAPGATWGDAYVEIPAGLGPAIEMKVIDGDLQVSHRFTIDTKSCHV